MESLIKIRHLRCFLEVVRLGSVGKAADRLAVTQPAVSKTIRELEDILGVPLLDRSKRGVVLSQFGEIFHKYASSSMAELREGLSIIAQARSGEGRVVAGGMLPNVTGPLMPAAIAAFKAQGGRAHIRLVTGINESLLALLRSGELEFVAGRLADPRHLAGLAFEHLYSERLCLAVRVGHPALRNKVAALAAFAEHPVLLPTAGTIIRHEAERFLAGCGIALPTDWVESVSASFGRSFVLSNDAVWTVPFGMVEADLESGLLAELPIDTSSTEAPVGLTTRAGAQPSPPATLMIACIRSVAAELRNKRQRATGPR